MINVYSFYRKPSHGKPILVLLARSSDINFPDLILEHLHSNYKFRYYYHKHHSVCFDDTFDCTGKSVLEAVLYRNGLQFDSK